VGAARLGARQVEEGDRARLGRPGQVVHLDARRPLAGRVHLVGHDQQLAADGQRVRPHATVRQHGLGEQLRRPGIGDVEHAEVGRPPLVRQVEVAAAASFEQGNALAAVAVAAQVVSAQVPHPTAFHRLPGHWLPGHWLPGHWLLSHWVLSHPSRRSGLGGVPLCAARLVD